MNKPLAETGLPTKRQRLVETAKLLFYNEGYASTTFLRISNASGINNGLIAYYFGTKNNLASEIYTDYILAVRNEIAAQLYRLNKDYTLDLGIAVETRFSLSSKFEDENLMRFYIEYTRERRSSAVSGRNPKREKYYMLQKRLLNPAISDIDLSLYEVCGIAVIHSLVEAYAKNIYRWDPKYIEDFAIRQLFTLLQLPAERIEDLLAESKKLSELINIKAGPGFVLKTE